MADDNEYILAESGGRGKRFLAKLVSFQGHNLLDLRYWYTDSDGNLRPTRKGLSLTAGHFGIVVETIAKFGAVIQAWLSGESNLHGLIEKTERETTAEAVRARRIATQQAATSSRYNHGQTLSAVLEEPRSRAFFVVEHHGGAEYVLYNKHHPFTERLAQAESAKEMRLLVTAILAAYTRARHSVEDDSDEGLLDLLEHEWAERLASAASRR